MASREIKMGGQAVIEGVMMRSEDMWAVAVRSPDGGIKLRRGRWTPVAKRLPILKLPFLRGMVVLIETLVLGIKALNWSADIATTGESGRTESQEKGLWWGLTMAGTVAFSLLLGIAAFFYLPLMLTEWLGVKNPVLFNVVDGIFRVVLFLGYLAVISRWKEIARVFEYHGAEHQVIAAWEDKKELTWENIHPYSTFHPRCGTSFILILMLVSILVFMFLGRPENIGERLVRMLFIPLIGGVSYELIRLSGKYARNRVARALIAPGLWLQRITTSTPDESQVEVAVASLRAALGLDESEEKAQQETPLAAEA